MTKTLQDKINEAIQPIIEQTQLQLDRVHKDDTQGMRNRLQLAKQHYAEKKDPKASVQPGQIWAHTDRRGRIFIFIVEQVKPDIIEFGMFHDLDKQPEKFQAYPSELKDDNWEHLFHFNDIADWCVKYLK